jgi:hypothetical protein
VQLLQVQQGRAEYEPEIKHKPISDSSTNSMSIIFENAIGHIDFEIKQNDIGLLRLIVNKCSYLSKAPALELIGALGAFYKLNRTHKFVQVLEVNAEYPPDVDIILACIALMRENNLYFMEFLICTGIVVYAHVDLCKTYMKNFKTAKPVHYLADIAAADDLYYMAVS